jgi:NADPH:quinone reductase-like Zn-dependent oxidoreductase
MRALRLEKTGSLEELIIREVPIPIPATAEVLVSGPLWKGEERWVGV